MLQIDSYKLRKTNKFHPLPADKKKLNNFNQQLVDLHIYNLFTSKCENYNTIVIHKLSQCASFIVAIKINNRIRFTSFDIRLNEMRNKISRCSENKDSAQKVQSKKIKIIYNKELKRCYPIFISTGNELKQLQNWTE